MLPCFIPAKVGIPLTSPTVPPKIKQKNIHPQPVAILYLIYLAVSMEQFFAHFEGDKD